MSQPFQCAHASDLDIEQLLTKLVEQLNPPFSHTLGFVYITDVLHDQAHTILNSLKERTGIQHWAGTVGIGIIGGDTEYYNKPAIAVMLCDFNEDSFAMLPSLQSNILPFITTLESWYQQHNISHALIHGDPNNPGLQAILAQLKQRTQNTGYCGGLVSSRGSFPQICDQLTTAGISGVLFSDDIPMLTNLSQGCSPISPIYTITESERNLLITLDNQPALQVFKNDIGEVLSRDIERAAGYIFAGIETESDNPDDYMVRNIIGVDEKNNVLAIGEYVETGQSLLFCRRDGNTAQQDLLRMLDKTKKRLTTTPKGGIYISCIGRGKNQFGDNSEEVRMIRATLGEFPLVGFFANGEFFNTNLYSFTGVLMLFL